MVKELSEIQSQPQTQPHIPQNEEILLNHEKKHSPYSSTTSIEREEISHHNRISQHEDANEKNSNEKNSNEMNSNVVYHPDKLHGEWAERLLSHSQQVIFD
jgi:hypothetical protein